MKEVTIKVYEFEELNAKAKEKAKERILEMNESFIIEDLKESATYFLDEKCGVKCEYDSICYDLYCNDFSCKGKVFSLEQFFRIFDIKIDDEILKNKDEFEIFLKHSNRYSCINYEIEYYGDNEELENKLLDLEDFLKNDSSLEYEVLRFLKECYEYYEDDKFFIEECAANEIYFLENGEIF